MTTGKTISYRALEQGVAEIPHVQDGAVAVRRYPMSKIRETDLDRLKPQSQKTN